MTTNEKQFKAKPDGMREAAAWPDEVPFLEPIVEKLRDEGMDELVIAQSAYDYMASQCYTRDGRYTMHLNNQVADGIKELMREGKWSNLSAIAKDATSSAFTAISEEARKFSRANDHDDALLEMVSKHCEMQYKFMKTSTSEYRVFAQELLKQADIYDEEERKRKEAKEVKP